MVAFLHAAHTYYCYSCYYFHYYYYYYYNNCSLNYYYSSNYCYSNYYYSYYVLLIVLVAGPLQQRYHEWYHWEWEFQSLEYQQVFD